MSSFPSILISICLPLLFFTTVSTIAGDETSRPWLTPGVKVQLGSPVVVAQTGTASLPWGVWQFPTISEPEPGVMLLAFNSNEDRPHNSIAEMKPAGRYTSTDGGKTWQPASIRPGFTSLYTPISLCHRRNGDVLYLDAPVGCEVPKDRLPPPAGIHNVTYTVRDSRLIPENLFPQSNLMLRQAGSSEWDSTPVAIDDPDAGCISFDPPGRDYAIIRPSRLVQVLELPDGSLLAIRGDLRLGPDRKVLPKWAVWCLNSKDDGRTWKFQGMIASNDENQPINGYCEPCATILPDGSLLAALRTEGGMETDQKTGVLYLAQSYDNGQTWSKPRAINPFGVFPGLLTLENGVTVLSFGRPGVNLLFNADGRGEKWDGLTLLVNEGQRFRHTSGYTSMIPTGPDRFLIAYDQFDYPNAQSEPCKSILVREVVVSR